MRELAIATKVALFNQVPLGIGQQHALRDLRLEEVMIAAIKSDIDNIVAQDLADIETTETIISPLRRIYEGIQKLREQSSVRISISQQLRFLILVIQNNLNQLQSTIDSVDIQATLETISRDIGRVPKLNREIKLSDEAFMPKHYTSTVHHWAETPWSEPGRNSDERLEFFRGEHEGSHIASVRLHLLAQDEDTKCQGEAFSYADMDFYAVGDLQADHLQPSESIVFRQMEMIEAMNLDPLFRDQMLQAGKEQGYFVEVEKAGKKQFFGSKKFFMEYYNCVGNLWLVSAAVNTGLGKGNQDPITWLKGNAQFGAAFFSSIGGEDSICKDGILYTTKEGQLLCDAVKTWVHKQYGEDRVTTSYLRYQVTKPLLQHLSEAKGDKRARVKGMATLSVMHQLADRRIQPPRKKQRVSTEKDVAPRDDGASMHSQDSDGSQPISSSSSPIGSIHSSDAEITEKNLERMDRATKRKSKQIRRTEIAEEYLKLSREEKSAKLTYK